MSQQDHEAEGRRIAFLKRKKEEREEAESRAKYFALINDPNWNKTTPERKQELKDRLMSCVTYKR